MGSLTERVMDIAIMACREGLELKELKLQKDDYETLKSEMGSRLFPPEDKIFSTFTINGPTGPIGVHLALTSLFIIGERNA